MKNFRILALAAALPLAACGQKPAPPAPAPSTNASQPSTLLGSKVQQAMDKAKAELETKNLSIGSNGVGISVNGRKINDNDNDNLSKAEITPQGELLIEGAKVATTPEQQALLKQYRGELIEVAKAGMDIGVQGADLGMKAAREALLGIFGGADEKQIEQRVEAQAEGIKMAARQLCNRLPALLASQQTLAAALPEFKPYATMEQSDIDDCADEISGNGVAVMSDEERAQLRQDIRDGVREGIRDAAQMIPPPAPPAPPPPPAPPAPAAR